MRIAVLLPSEISSWFNSHAFEGIYEVMSKADYDVVPYIVWTQEDLDRFFQNLPGNRNVDESSKHPSTSTRQRSGYSAN